MRITGAQNFLNQKCPCRYLIRNSLCDKIWNFDSLIRETDGTVIRPPSSFSTASTSAMHQRNLSARNFKRCSTESMGSASASTNSIYSVGGESATSGEGDSGMGPSERASIAKWVCVILMFIHEAGSDHYFNASSLFKNLAKQTNFKWSLPAKSDLVDHWWRIHVLLELLIHTASCNNYQVRSSVPSIQGLTGPGNLLDSGYFLTIWSGSVVLTTFHCFIGL